MYLKELIVADVEAIEELEKDLVVDVWAGNYWLNIVHNEMRQRQYRINKHRELVEKTKRRLRILVNQELRGLDRLEV